jgi:transcription initiation factor TFIIIB Brf1 subunit/transcription initiation factor TFIIB
MVILPHSNNSNKSSITHETTPICTTLAKCPVLYLSSIKSGEAVTQTSIAEAAGVTEVTVRNRFKDLKSKLGLN